MYTIVDLFPKIHMLWFNVIRGSNFIFLCFKLITTHYHTQNQKKIKSKPRIKLNHNTYRQHLLTLSHFHSKGC